MWFAIAGMLGAPLGSWMAGYISESLLLLLFAILMLTVASRMWQSSLRGADSHENTRARERGPACRRTADGRLRLTSRCAALLAVLGLISGFLSGLFGVGGGFVIVPALVLFSGMSMHRAVGTSLLIIVLISITGVASHLTAGRAFSWEITGLFLLGGVAGMTLGTKLGRHLSGPKLQRVFAIAIVAVAMFVIGKTSIGHF
jgi:hypothetical protein